MNREPKREELNMKPAIRNFLGGVAAVAMMAGATVSAQAADWKYAFEESLTEVQGVYATKFKEAVEANSDHTIQLFPYGTLGESADIMEQAQAGILQFVDQSPGFTGALIPEAQVFFVPYLLPTDQAHLARRHPDAAAVGRGLWRPADQHHPGPGKPDLLPVFDRHLRGDRSHHLYRSQQFHDRGHGQQGLL